MTIESHIAELKKKHAALDAQIVDLQKDRGHDALSVRALKRQKLILKEDIARLTGELAPNPEPDPEQTDEHEDPEPECAEPSLPTGDNHNHTPCPVAA